MNIFIVTRNAQGVRITRHDVFFGNLALHVFQQLYQIHPRGSSN